MNAIIMMRGEEYIAYNLEWSEQHNGWLSSCFTILNFNDGMHKEMLRGRGLFKQAAIDELLLLV